MKAVIVLFAFILGSLPLCAQFTLAWSADNLAGTMPGDSPDARFSNLSITRGSGLTAQTLFPGFFDSFDWSTSGSFPGIGSGSYLSITFDIDPLYQWLPSSISLSYQDAGGGNSARHLQLRYSGDTYSNSLFLDTSIVSFPGGNDVNVVDLSALQPMTGTVEFRLYGYGALNTGGVLGLANDASLSFGGESRSVLLQGDLELIPEPAHLSLFFALFSLLAVIRLRRKP